MNRIWTSTGAALLAGAVLAAFAGGCADTVTGRQPGRTVTVAVQLQKNTSALQESFQAFILTVARVRDGVLLAADTSYDLTASVVTVTVENLPSGEPLEFVVSILNDAGVEVYGGRQVQEIAPDLTTVIDLPLTPSVPMLKFVPRYIAPLDSGAVLDTVIQACFYRQPALYGIAFRVYYRNDLVRIDSVGPSPALAALVAGGEVLFLPPQFVQVQTGLGYWAVALTQTVPGRALVDAAARGPLVDVHVQSLGVGAPAAASTSIWLAPTSMTLTDGTAIDSTQVTAVLYTDDCYIDAGSPGPM